jgi:hypothetical protein
MGRPQRCVVCGALLISGGRGRPSLTCSPEHTALRRKRMQRRYKTSEVGRKVNRRSVSKWRAAHLEEARELGRRRYRARKAAQQASALEGGR